MLCEYGCGQEAKYQLKNGKWCCSESYNKCPELRRKNSQRRLETSYKIKCDYCDQEISKEVFNKHSKKCNKIKRLLTSKKKLLNIEKSNIYIIRYNKIISLRNNHPLLPTDIYEIHHILPKCLHGTDDFDNLICLTPREHYVCHALLAEAFKNTIYTEKLYCAFFRMSTKDNQKINSRIYEKLKIGYKNIAKTHQTTKNKIVVNKDGKNKFINKEDLNDYLINGWVKGLKINNYNRNFNHNKGKIAVYKDNKKTFILLNELDIYLQNGWIRKIKEKPLKMVYIWINNGNENCKIPKQDLEIYLNNGWEKGRMRLPMRGRILINDNLNQKFIQRDKLSEYINKGWKLGGIKGLKAGKPKSFRTKEHCLKLSKSNKGKHTNKQ